MDILYIACVVFLLPSVVTALEDTKPEIITTENNDYFGYMKDFTGFQCQAKGTNLKYSWTHNDIIIDPDYILKFSKTNASTLQPLPSNIDKTYEGYYQCFVENSIGKIVGRKALVQFTIVGKFQPYPSPPEPKVAYVDDTFSLHCPTHALSQKVRYYWFYESADRRLPLPPSKNYFVTNNGTLYFSMLGDADIKFINDNGGILCEQLAWPGGSVSQSIELSHRITLTKRTRSGGKKKRKPEIKTTFTDHTIYYGSGNLVLKCGAIGYPIPDLTWYKVDSVDNKEIKITSGTDYKLTSFNQFLTIKNVGSDRAGQYKCKASNTEGTYEASGTVKVAQLPQWMIDSELVDSKPPLYSSFEWMCGAFGGPTYKWYRNGVEIFKSSPDGKFRIENRNGKSYLIIKNITSEYNGMYQCTAANELDVIYSTARLEVVDTSTNYQSPTPQPTPVITIPSTKPTTSIVKLDATIATSPTTSNFRLYSTLATSPTSFDLNSDIGIATSLTTSDILPDSTMTILPSSSTISNPPGNGDSSSTIIVIAAVVPVVLLIILVGVVWFLCKRKKRNGTDNGLNYKGDLQLVPDGQDKNKS